MRHCSRAGPQRQREGGEECRSRRFATARRRLRPGPGHRGFAQPQCANVNASTDHGITPLHEAAFAGYPADRPGTTRRRRPPQRDHLNLGEGPLHVARQGMAAADRLRCALPRSDRHDTDRARRPVPRGRLPVPRARAFSEGRATDRLSGRPPLPRLNNAASCASVILSRGGISICLRSISRPAALSRSMQHCRPRCSTCPRRDSHGKADSAAPARSIERNGRVFG